MILLTDGSNTGGKVDPREGAQAAKTLGVKIYTIGVGSNGYVPFPTEFGLQKVKLDLDEKLLNDIATETQGKYFRATDTQALREVYQTIDKLEKSTIEIKTFHEKTEHFALFVYAAILFLFLELILAFLKFGKLP